jgi:diketogulonate reductase-like aldo/keto reductase
MKEKLALPWKKADFPAQMSLWQPSTLVQTASTSQLPLRTVSTAYALSYFGASALLTVTAEQLGISYVDLYLVHSPRLAVPDIPTCWAQMEKVKEDGLAKWMICEIVLQDKLTSDCRSIGISNFGVEDMEILIASAKIKPAVNQVCSIELCKNFLHQLA